VAPIVEFANNDVLVCDVADVKAVWHSGEPHLLSHGCRDPGLLDKAGLPCVFCAVSSQTFSTQDHFDA